MSERDVEKSEIEKSERGNKPVETLRDGALKVSIFRNRGEKGDYYALDPSRIYTDEQTREIREASSLNPTEALRMSHLLTQGYERVGALRQQTKEQAKEQARDNAVPGKSRDDNGRER